MTGRSAPHVELERRAERDIRRLSARDQDRVERALIEVLEAEPILPNADVKPLAGAKPWLRLRTGQLRILFRPLTGEERKKLRVRRGYLVSRVVHRRDLFRATETLRCGGAG